MGVEVGKDDAWEVCEAPEEEDQPRPRAAPAPPSNRSLGQTGTALAQAQQPAPLFPFALDVGDGRLLGLLCDAGSQRCQPASALVLAAWAERAVAELPLVLSPDTHARAASYIYNRSLHNETLAPAQLPRGWRKLLRLRSGSWTDAPAEAPLCRRLSAAPSLPPPLCRPLSATASLPHPLCRTLSAAPSLPPPLCRRLSA